MSSSSDWTGENPPKRGTDLTLMSIKDMVDWATPEEPEDIIRDKRLFLQVRIQMGRGTLQEKLTRLLVWAGARLITTETHSEIYETFEILKEGTAWCDQQCKVFSFFALHLLHVKCRELALHHCDGTSGHAVCEAYFDGAWHLMDVHSDHCTTYPHPDDGHWMSWEELAMDPRPFAIEDHWWKGTNGIGKKGLYTKQFPPHYYHPFPDYTLAPLARHRPELSDTPNEHYANPSWDRFLWDGSWDLVP